MKVLVLGSHGCVGRAVCKLFQEKGHDVVPWDIQMGAEYDLRIPGNLDSVLPSVDFVLFLAFDVGGSKYNINSVQYINNNVNLIMNTMNSLEKCKKPFIHSSSQMSNMNNNPYAVLKRLCELYTQQVNGINIKLWNVYGNEPITEKSHVIPDFVDQALTKGIIQMRTNGSEERQFVYCDDFAEALYIIVQNYEKFRAMEAIDISSFVWVTIKETALLLQQIAKEETGKDVRVLEGDYVDTFHNRKNFPEQSLLNTLWSPRVSLKEGLRRVFLEQLTLKQNISNSSTE